MKRILPIALLSLLLAACGQEEPTAKKNKKRAAQEHLVRVVEAMPRRLAPEAVRTGTLRARREVRIHNQEEGRVERMPLFEGDHAAIHTLLVTLDQSLLRAELDKARAQRRQAAQDLKRVEGLSRKQLISDEELARTRTALDVAIAEATLLETRMGHTEIHAPFNGVVTERLLEPGDIAPRYTHLLTLMDPTSLITEVAVSELLLPTLSIGDPVSIRIDALGDSDHPGHISRIHPTLDPDSRLGKVEIALDPVPEGARPGQLCRVRLAGAARERLALPFGALRRDQEGEHLYITLENGKVERRAVTSGLRLAGAVEILEGLEAGERVVTHGFLGISDGKTVKIVE